MPGVESPDKRAFAPFANKFVINDLCLLAEMVLGRYSIQATIPALGSRLSEHVLLQACQ